jgi:NAD(P)-dependent dehydrogenase (short-subunit alcohol dehydrogenase family)
MGIVGQNAIVTGASRGIGAEIAKALIKDGVNVAVVARTESALKELAKSADGSAGRVAVIPADVSSADSVRDMVAQARAELGEIHILVNSAGVLDNEGIAGHSDETWRWTFGVNIDSYFYTIREVIGEMIERKSGRIVNIASTSGKIAIGPNRAAYVASKHAVMGLNREVAVEAAPHQVTVNAICPGFVLTEMVEDSMRKFARDFGQTPEETRASFIDKIPLGRFIAPEEVVPLLRFLISDGAGAITGQAISVDGGFAPL